MLKQALFLLATLVVLGMNNVTAAPMAPPWTFDVRTLMSDGKGVLYAGTTAGMYKSTNGGGNWNRVAIIGEWVTSLDSMVSDSFGVLYASDGADVYKSTDGGAHWDLAGRRVWGGGGGALFIDSNNDVYVYGGVYSRNLYRSSNGGVNWSRVTSGLPTDEHVDATAIAESCGSLYVVMKPGEVFKSVNRGKTWKIDASINRLGRIDAPLLADTEGAIYANIGDGRIFRKTKTSDNWTEISATLKDGDKLKVIAAGNDALYAFTRDIVTRTRSLYKGSKDGRDWVNINANLPKGAQIINVVTNAPEALYLLTSVGIYRSTNGGKNWTSASNGMPPIGARERPR